MIFRMIDATLDYFGCSKFSILFIIHGLGNSRINISRSNENVKELQNKQKKEIKKIEINKKLLIMEDVNKF